MAWFVKHETFTVAAAALSTEQRRPTLEAHRNWVSGEASAGRRLRSGFLVDANRQPGGGGLLMFEAESYAEALLCSERPEVQPLVDGPQWIPPGDVAMRRCTSPA